jgi:hypothetical protein
MKDKEKQKIIINTYQMLDTVCVCVCVCVCESVCVCVCVCV